MNGELRYLTSSTIYVLVKTLMITEEMHFIVFKTRVHYSISTFLCLNLVQYLHIARDI